MSTSAPVVVFGYNRPNDLYNLLDALSKCKGIENTDVYIYIDGPRKSIDNELVNKSIRVAYEIEGFKSKKVVISKINKGLAASIIDGVSTILKQYKKIIVLEDDLILNNEFLVIMNRMLDCYKNDPKIWSISGYSFPIDVSDIKQDWYSVTRSSSWGWATWEDRWSTIDWDINSLLNNNKNKIPKLFREIKDSKMMIYNYLNGFINSWALRWTLNQFFQNKVSLSPKYSIVKNNGFSSNATHGSMRSDYNENYRPEFTPISVDYVEDEKIKKRFANYTKPTLINYFSYMLKKFKLYYFAREAVRKWKR
ncbi:hypothetical protein [Metabacillus idriensis]|uniref:hypothetical protein n=1 Tax=Metabacillus idriensis TaxID=324768 RepID=UPI003D2AF025